MSDIDIAQQLSTCSIQDYCLNPDDKREMDSILQQVGLTDIMNGLKTEIRSQMTGGYKIHFGKSFRKTKKHSSIIQSRTTIRGGASQSSTRVDFLSKMLAIICLLIFEGFTIHHIIMYIGQPDNKSDASCESASSETIIQSYKYVYDLLSIEFEAIMDTWIPDYRCEQQLDTRSLMLRTAQERWSKAAALTQSGVNKTCIARDSEYYSRVYYFCYFIGSIFLHIFKQLGYSRPEEFARYLETRPVFKHLGDIFTVGQALMANPLEALSPTTFNRIKEIGGFNAVGAFFSLSIKWLLTTGIFTQRKLFNIFTNGFRYLMTGSSREDLIQGISSGEVINATSQEGQIEEKFEEVLQQSNKALLNQVLCAVPVASSSSSRRERIRLSSNDIDSIINKAMESTSSRGGNKKRNKTKSSKTLKRSKKQRVTSKRYNKK